MKTAKIRTLILTFFIEMIVYGFLVVVYFLLVLRLLSGVLTQLYQDHLIFYAFLGLGLIVAQGVFLEHITTFIINRLKLERLE